MSGTHAPLANLSPDDQGAANIIVAYFLIFSTCAFWTVRFAVGRQRLLQLEADDATFGLAVIFGIAMSIVSHFQVRAGLGRHQSTVSDDDVSSYFKLVYVDRFLAVTAMALAKFSLILLFRRIMSNSGAVAHFIALSVAIGVYFIFGIFTAAFFCGLPDPWVLDPPVCPTHGHLLYASTAMNILTDGLLAVWLLPSLWQLNMGKSNRYVVMTLFAARIVVIGVAVGQIVVTERSLRHSDQTWYALPRAILEQIVVHVSIIHATLPRIHSFLANLQTGLLATRLTTAASSKNRSKNSKDSGGKAKDSSGQHGAGKRNSRASLNVPFKNKGKPSSAPMISSTSYDYPVSQDDSRHGNATNHNHPGEADGNIINGMKLRPDIMPGSKWQTTIYSDGDARERQHSASTARDDLAMGSRIDEEDSESSLHEAPAPFGRDPRLGGGGGDVIEMDDRGRDRDAAARDGAARRSRQVSLQRGARASGQPGVLQTREFKMQIERVGRNGESVDVTKRENREVGMAV